MGKAPKKAEIILGQDINANIGVQGGEEGFEKVIGTHSFDNRNEKGLWALQWLSLFDLKATNTFFQHQEYATHTAYLPPILPRILDIISVSSFFFKRVRNCSLCE